MAMNSHTSETSSLVQEYGPLVEGPLVNDWVSYEQQSQTLLLDDVELQLDQCLGDEELGVSLLIESLEQQYEDMILEGCQDEDIISLQSAKEWLTAQPGKIAGLFNFLSNMTVDQNQQKTQ